MPKPMPTRPLTTKLTTDAPGGDAGGIAGLAGHELLQRRQCQRAAHAQADAQQAAAQS